METHCLVFESVGYFCAVALKEHNDEAASQDQNDSFLPRKALPTSEREPLCVLKPENLKNEIIASKSWKGLTSHLKQRSSQTVKGKND